MLAHNFQLMRVFFPDQNNIGRQIDHRRVCMYECMISDTFLYSKAFFSKLYIEFPNRHAILFSHELYLCRQERIIFFKSPEN